MSVNGQEAKTHDKIMISLRKSIIVCVWSVVLIDAVSIAQPVEIKKASSSSTNPANAIEGTKDVAILITQASEHMASELCKAIADKQIVAVLPAVDSDGGVRRLGVLVADEIQRKLLTDGVKLTDRQNINAVMGERDFQLGTLESADGIAMAGQIAGADILVIGKITLAGKNVLLSAQAISVKTGRPLSMSRSYSIPSNRLDQLMWYVRRPEKDSTGGKLPPLSLRYEFVTPARSGDAPLADGATVSSGQRFKIRVQPNSDCYLYVLLYDSRGNASVLFPHGKIGLPNDVRGGVSYEIPEGTKWYWFDERPGTETFYLVASYTPLEDLDQILSKMEKTAGQNKHIAKVARAQIDTMITRGMSSNSSEQYRPKGIAVQTRGVGGIVDTGWGEPAKTSTAEVDNIVEGHATAVKKVVLNHR